MRFLRSLVNWTVPANLQTALLNAGYAVSGNRVAANVSLRNRHKGKRCFVIGNGPSLGQMDLKPLANHITIAANSFYKHPDATAIQLRYLCIGDERFMVDEPRAVEWHRLIEEHLPTASLLLNPRARQLIQKYRLYQGHDVFFFKRGVVADYPELIDFDLTKPINVGNTTGTQLAIPLALYMGCTDIVLLGFDCNWLESYTGSYHFYTNHAQFPEFDALNTDDRWGRYEDHLIFALRDFEAHRLIAERSLQLGVSIRNATLGGLLDMYPRVRLEDCLNSS
jgi:hypothetical protein